VTREVERRRRALLVGVWGLVAGAVTLAWAVGAFATAELAVGDAHFAVRGRERPDPRIVLVLIDPRSLNAIDVYPFPRRLHAELIDRLREAGAGVIAYDIVFAERGPTVADDNDLLGAIERAGNVVVAADATDGAGRPDALFGDPEGVRAVAGDSDFELDPGGVYRRVTATVNGLASFAVVVARRAGRSAGPGAVRSGAVASGAVGSLRGHGEPIDFAGPAGTYPSVSFSDALDGRIPASFFRGRIVVVGASDPTLQDVHPTPTSVAMPGAEIQANAIATVLAGVPLRFAPWWLAVVAILGLSGVAPAAGIRFGPRLAISVPVALAAAVVYVLISQLAFGWGWMIDVVGPIVGLLATLPMLAAIDFVTVGYQHGVEAERHAAELRGARRRAIEAADEARRQVERDIHDGAQQQILAVAMTLSQAGETLSGGRSGETLSGGRSGGAPDPGGKSAGLAGGAAVAGERADLGELLERSATRLLEAVQGLRTLARGAYPPTLVEAGLDAAIEALVAELPGLVRIRGRIGRRVPGEVEAVCYFCVSEGLANALKHAGATTIEVAAGAGEGSVWVEVRDDGAGGADPRGTGLAGLRERVESREGSLVVTSPPGGGTVVRGELPLEFAEPPPVAD
jgi:CHASE2 domain-containing sensor protein